ncbi:MAG: phage capsid protein [Desulfatibacillaceae bacterium]
MSTQITTGFVNHYHSNVDVMAQQKGSRLRPAVREERVTGKEAFFDQIRATAARRRTTRHGDTPLIDTPHDRRKVTLLDYDWADLIDDTDRVRLITDPTSAYVRNAAFAMGRAVDDVIIAAATGTAYSGVSGGTANTFDTTNNRVVSSSTGMTVAKILDAKEILDGYDIDPDIPRYLALTSAQVSDLLNATEVKSIDYNTVRALAEGNLNTFCGFNIVRTERLGLVGSERRCLAWARDGILLAVGKESSAKVTERPDKNYAVQVYYSMSVGAVRMSEDWVVDILCTES